GILVHIDDVKPVARPGPGWEGVELRFPIGSHNGSPNALFWMTLAPGAALPRHRHEWCEKVYHVVRGAGIADVAGARMSVRAGHTQLIAQGVEHCLSNASGAEPLALIGVLTGAGSLQQSGYVASA